MSMEDQNAVREAVSNNRYNEDIIPNLEVYVNYQNDNRTYDFDANLALLKLYQFYPMRTNLEIVAKILAKAMMNLPSTDFLLSTYLISEQVEVGKDIEDLQELANYLETAKFREFWKEMQNSSCRDLLSSIKGFDDAMRAFVIKTVSITHQSIALDVLAENLALTPKECDQFVAENGWKADEHMVYFPVNQDNQAKAKKYVENIQFSQMNSLLSSMC